MTLIIGGFHNFPPKKILGLHKPYLTKHNMPYPCVSVAADIDLKEEFDSLNHEPLWQILRHK